jgi:hypothetical protein
MPNILFISKVKTLSDNCSSTDIMTNNLIFGLSQTNNDLTLLLLSDSREEEVILQKYYNKYAKQVLVLRRFFHEGQSKYRFLLGGIFSLIKRSKYKKELKKVFNSIKKTEVVVANKVTVDEIIYGDLVKQHLPNVHYYQYWSDPMTLSGITRDQFIKMPRRWPFRILESNLLRHSDLIIYGTKTLSLSQVSFFKKYRNKIRYVDICYSPNTPNKSKEELSSRLLYAGNYYSRIRNIIPLARSISLQEKYQLDIYGDGDVNLSEYKGVVAKKRVDRQTLTKIETHYDAIICVLNRSTVQIPGKIFYDMQSSKTIIVLTDGPFGNVILEELKAYKRFIVCRNNVSDILELLRTINLSSPIDLGRIEKEYSPKMIAETLIYGGKTLGI